MTKKLENLPSFQRVNNAFRTSKVDVAYFVILLLFSFI